PFSIENLDIERPATVTVRGFDGAHQARVSGTTTIENLHVGSATIVLGIEGKPPPPLILMRQPLLAGIALSDVASMTVATAKGQPTVLLAVTPTAETRGFFEVEPGGFGAEVTNGQELTVEFTFLTAGTSLPKSHVVTTFDSAGPVFRAP